MVLVFILCAIIIIITLLVCVILLSTLKIEFRNFKASNMQKNSEDIKDSIDSLLDENGEQPKESTDSNISKDYKIKISLQLFSKLKWLWFNINNTKMQKMSSKIDFQKIDFKKLEKNISFEDIKQFKKLQLKLTYLNLESKLGVEDVIATSFLVAIISSIISIILPYIAVKKKNKNQYHYKIVPLYLEKNVYEIQFDGIIEIKMVHIINILYYFILKKRREKKYEQRTSNRGPYGYSYE